MIRSGDTLRAKWRVAFLTLAVLAMAMKIIVPPGMMAAPATAGGHFAFPLVICTGHGPAIIPTGDLAPKAPGQKSRADGPCAFAGHMAGFAPPLFARLTLPFATPAIPSDIARFDLAPGRGLAAPPPPSQGPPLLIL